MLKLTLMYLVFVCPVSFTSDCMRVKTCSLCDLCVVISVLIHSSILSQIHREAGLKMTSVASCLYLLVSVFVSQ